MEFFLLWGGGGGGGGGGVEMLLQLKLRESVIHDAVSSSGVAKPGLGQCPVLNACSSYAKCDIARYCKQSKTGGVVEGLEMRLPHCKHSKLDVKN